MYRANASSREGSFIRTEMSAARAHGPTDTISRNTAQTCRRACEKSLDGCMPFVAQVWGQGAIPVSRQIGWISGTIHAHWSPSAEANAQESAQVPAYARFRPAVIPSLLSCASTALDSNQQAGWALVASSSTYML